MYLIFATVLNLLHVPNFKKFNSRFATNFIRKRMLTKLGEISRYFLICSLYHSNFATCTNFTVGTEDDGVQILILRRGGMILQAVKAAGRGVGGELLEPVAQKIW